MEVIIIVNLTIITYKLDIKLWTCVFSTKKTVIKKKKALLITLKLYIQLSCFLIVFNVFITGVKPRYNTSRFPNVAHQLPISYFSCGCTAEWSEND